MAEQRSGWIGTILQNKWRIEAKIARGGVATVFRAKHRRGQIAAIKIMHPELARNPDVRSRFLREGYAANKVDHPGVVSVLDDDVTEDGSAYIVMELLEDGELLEEKRERLGGWLPVDEVVSISDQLLDVLAAAHDKGIIHRDIKPDNLFVLSDGTLKVLDFGIAHIKEAAASAEPTQTGLLLGTPEFMSPEQALGKRGHIDAQTDIFAVGATMFTLLSGEAVHAYDQLSALLMAASSRQARSLASVAVKGIPREIIAVVDKALALEKPRRWASARAMQDALRAASPSLRAAVEAAAAAPPRPSVVPPPTITPRGGTMVVGLSATGSRPSVVPPPGPTTGARPSVPPPAGLSATGSRPSVPPPAGLSATGSRPSVPPPPPRGTPRSGVKLPVPLPSRPPIALPSRTSARPPTRAQPAKSEAKEPAPISAPTVVKSFEPPPPSFVPPSDPTAIRTPPPPPSLAPVSQATAVLSQSGGRTEIKPGGDAWTTEFTHGDMEGPTVSALDGPPDLDLEATNPLATSAHAAKHDLDATQALVRDDQQATALDLAAQAPSAARRPLAFPEAPNAARARAIAESPVDIPLPPPRRVEAPPAIPAPPLRTGESPIAPPLRTGESPIAAPTYRSGESPIAAPTYRSGENPIAVQPPAPYGPNPVAPYLSTPPAPPVQPFGAPWAQPRPPQAPAPSIWQQLVKPSPLLLAEIAVAALVLITLTIGGCLLLNR